MQMQSLQGSFLIATRQMPDPRFSRQVVYICVHSGEGTMGVAVNQPAQISFSEVLRLAQIDEKVKRDWPPVYIGGPVEMERAFFLYSSDYNLDNCLIVTAQTRITSDGRILADIAAGHGPESFLFILGYAGWGPGQLENELSTQGWLVLPGDVDILFNTPDDLKWRQAAEKYGIDIALFNDEPGSA